MTGDLLMSYQKSDISPTAYRLKLPPRWGCIHNVFYVSKLRPYREDLEIHDRPAPPPPILIDGEEEWEVARIKDSRIHRRWKKLQFLVEWKGFPGEDSWENIKNV